MHVVAENTSGVMMENMAQKQKKTHTRTTDRDTSQSTSFLVPPFFFRTGEPEYIQYVHMYATKHACSCVQITHSGGNRAARTCARCQQGKENCYRFFFSSLSCTTCTHAYTSLSLPLTTHSKPVNFAKEPAGADINSMEMNEMPSCFSEISRK